MADIVGSAHDPKKRLAELAVEICVMSLSHAQRLERCSRWEAREPSMLCAGDGCSIGPSNRCRAGGVGQERAALQKGQALVRESKPLRPGCASAILPLRQDDRVTAVLYLDGQQESFLSAVREAASPSPRRSCCALERGAFPAAARPLRQAWEEYLAETPAEQVARAQLVALLDRNRWNIAPGGPLDARHARAPCACFRAVRRQPKKIRRTPDARSRADRASSPPAL